VCEVGLGGRLDATNIVTPLLTVITNIGLDHMQYLGDTHAKIAAEKAGILKPGVPLVCGVNHAEARQVIHARAAELGSDVRQLDRDFSLRRYRKGFGPDGFSQSLDFEGRAGRRQFAISMGGLHQLDNAACAAAALEILAEQGLLPDLDRAFAALVHARLPGRLQVLEKGRLLVDGAHNADGIQSLSRSLSDAFLGQKFHLVCGMMADKDLEALLAAIGPKAASLSCVGVNNPRALAPETFAERARAVLSCPVAAYPRWQDALAVTLAKKDALTLVFGSLYLVGEVLAGLAPESVNSDDLA
jgi:dihydrofolate synthase/folylpolyglutamate synthase